MIDDLLFYYCLILSTGGWIICLYEKHSQKKISRATEFLVIKSEGNTSRLESDKRYIKFLESWEIGDWFTTKWFQGLGLFIGLGGSIIDVLENSWWTGLLVFWISPVIATFLMNIFRKFSQILSVFLVLILGLTTCIHFL